MKQREELTRLRGMTDIELAQTVLETEKAFTSLVFDTALRKNKKTHLLPIQRHQIAQMRTIQRERQIMQEDGQVTATAEEKHA